LSVIKGKEVYASFPFCFKQVRTFASSVKPPALKRQISNLSLKIMCIRSCDFCCYVQKKRFVLSF
jgi:hypothetical protein